jgi:uncharacterized protein YuzE
MTYDREHNVAYISLRDRDAVAGESRTQISVAEPDGTRGRIVLDLDSGGRLTGIEVFDARESLPIDVLDQAQLL